MSLEFTNYFDDVISSWETTNRAAISKLVKRCLIKGIIKKESFATLMLEVSNWDGRII